MKALVVTGDEKCACGGTGEIPSGKIFHAGRYAESYALCKCVQVATADDEVEAQRCGICEYWGHPYMDEQGEQVGECSFNHVKIGFIAAHFGRKCTYCRRKNG